MRLTFSSLLAAIALSSGLAHAAVSAVALSPDRTSVEADFSQVLSARFLDAAGHPAAGETVQFTNDACGRFPNGNFFATTTADANGIASMSFTAMQPGGVVCTVTASAGASVRFTVYTYRLAQISIDASLPSSLQPGQAFDIPVQVRMGAYALPNVDIGARVVAGSGSASVSPSSANTGSGVVNLTVNPTGAGDYDVVISVRTLTKTLPVRLTVAEAPTWREDLWWSCAAENGWGLTIVEHHGILFVMIYAYDDAGRPTWYVVSSGTWSADGTRYTGDIYSPRGTPFYSYDASRLVMGTPVGSASLTFSDTEHATLDYTINGVTGRKAITRFLFGPAVASPLAGLTDMWWGGVAQNGWGIAVVQQNASLFTLWYTYDASGLPLWFAMPSGAWTSSDTYEGRVYRTTGSAWLGRTYDPSLFNPVDVGSYRLRFTSTGATFEYSIEGRTGSLPLTRTPF